ncbi:MAG TPA: L,D-transpeptidase, partial [Paracoccus sp. (in: a-proteobacteria)]|nr:L,D-transpeptidase [Paracoccus sp. (in: a-proteobacteria)]
MLRLSPALAAVLATLAVAIAPAARAAERVPMTAADIESAIYPGTGDLPSGQSALTARVQILLDRAGVSPGVVDGFRGGMSESALMAYERKMGLPVDGRMDPVIWDLLQPFAAGPMTMDYTVTEEDAQGLVDSIPSDYGEKALMTSMGYISIAERLGERFHMDDKFLVQLNPGVTIAPGAVLKVTVPARPIRARVTRIIVDKETGRVAAYDAQGRMVVDYPATVGSAATPSPHGTHTVDAVALDPDYTYNPHKNFKQGDNDKVLRIPPGPNGPVGNVWIDLSEPTYGIHGTPTPSRLFVNQSNGCVRLTNWDARELAGMVIPRQTVVEFLAPGVRIADVTSPVMPALAAAMAEAAVPVPSGKPRPNPWRTAPAVGLSAEVATAAALSGDAAAPQAEAVLPGVPAPIPAPGQRRGAAADVAVADPVAGLPTEASAAGVPAGQDAPAPLIPAAPD